eukprot:g18571.t1
MQTPQLAGENDLAPTVYSACDFKVGQRIQVRAKKRPYEKLPGIIVSLQEKGAMVKVGTTETVHFFKFKDVITVEDNTDWQLMEEPIAVATAEDGNLDNMNKKDFRKLLIDIKACSSESTRASTTKAPASEPDLNQDLDSTPTKNLDSDLSAAGSATTNSAKGELSEVYKKWIRDTYDNYGQSANLKHLLEPVAVRYLVDEVIPNCRQCTPLPKTDKSRLLLCDISQAFLQSGSRSSKDRSPSPPPASSVWFWDDSHPRCTLTQDFNRNLAAGFFVEYCDRFSSFCVVECALTGDLYTEVLIYDVTPRTETNSS